MLGSAGAAAVIKRLRPQQLLYVVCRIKQRPQRLEEPGEQTGPAIQTSPEEVRKIREAQLDKDIVDVVAEQIRLLEEVQVLAEDGGTAKPFGSAKKSNGAVQGANLGVDQIAEEDPLPLELPARAVHLVDTEESLKSLEGVLQERLTGGADLDGAADSMMTPLLPVLGIDAEWRPFRGKEVPTPVALVQLAFRRSVFLLDLVRLRESPELLFRATEILRRCLEAEQLFKIGLGLSRDLQRLQKSFPEAIPPDGARSVLELSTLAAAALPDKEVPSGLSAFCKLILGKGLDKTEQTSDWEVRPLTASQIAYAAQDAHVCVRLFDALCYRHATLATQPLRPVLHALATDWRPNAEASGPPLLRLDIETCSASWRQATGRRLQGGIAECARWAVGVPGCTHATLFSAEADGQEQNGGKKRRLCLFANAAALFLRSEEEDFQSQLLPEEHAALLDLRGPLAVFVQLSGAWYCAGRAQATLVEVQEGGSGTGSCELQLLDLDLLAGTRLAAWASEFASRSAPAGIV